jgi:hypothetical protein
MNKQQGLSMSATISGATLTTNSNVAAGIGGAIVITGTFVIIAALIAVGVLAALVTMALTPPRTRTEFGGMLALAVASSLFGGPLAIEWFQLGWLSQTAQLGICFIVAAPAWLIARIIANQLGKWRDAKSPIREITNDLRGLPEVKNFPPMPSVQQTRKP